MDIQQVSNDFLLTAVQYWFQNGKRVICRFDDDFRPEIAAGISDNHKLINNRADTVNVDDFRV